MRRAALVNRRAAPSAIQPDRTFYEQSVKKTVRGNLILTRSSQRKHRNWRSPIASLANNLAEVVRAGFRPREPRIRVHVAARMRVGEKWTDVTILNISSRGLMARTTTVPPARSFVEIRRGPNVVIVGKVVWSDDRHFGIRTQDRIGISMMSDDGSVTAAAHDPAVERRTQARPHTPDPLEAFERSRRKAALAQFATIVAAGGIGAVLLSQLVTKVLATPFGEIARHL